MHGLYLSVLTGIDLHLLWAKASQSTHIWSNIGSKMGLDERKNLREAKLRGDWDKNVLLKKKKITKALYKYIFISHIA